MENQSVSSSSNTPTQHSLPSSTAPLSPKEIETNKAALRAFPQGDDRAMLSVKGNQLERQDGLTWATSYLSQKAQILTRRSTSQTNLENLQTTVQKTFTAVLTPFERQLHEWQTEAHQEEGEVKGSERPKPMTDRTLSEIEGDLEEARQMLQGFKNLRSSLMHQYRQSSSSEQQTLEEWNATIQAYTSRIEAGQVLVAELRDTLAQREARQQEAVSLQESVAGEAVEPIGQEDIEEALENNSPLMPVTPREAANINRAMSDLDTYLTYFGPNTVTPAQARAFIEEGTALVKRISDGSISDATRYPGGHEKALNALMWHFMSLALEKGQAHASGSFAIEDPGGKLFAFMNSTPAKNRKSTHYKQRKLPNQELRGVNSFTGTMPADKHHLHFGQITNTLSGKEPLFFLKIESSDPVGSKRDRVAHAGTLFQSIGRKALGTNDSFGTARENVPQPIKESFKSVLQSLPKEEEILLSQLHHNMTVEGFLIEDTLRPNPDQLISRFGIAYMTRFIKAAKDMGVAMDPQALKTFTDRLDELHLDHLESRNGKEVYLTHDEVLRKPPVKIHLYEEY